MAWDFDGISAGMLAAATAALVAEAEAIMADSKEHFVPVDEGVLRGSGHVTPPEQRGSEIVVTLAYGGAASAYALAVHEHPSAHSPRSWQAAEAAGHGVHFSPAGTGPGYLEIPVSLAADGLADRIAARIRESR